MSEQEEFFEFFDVEKFDPCDQCGVRSYVWISLPGGRVLSFCGSHFRKNREAFSEKGYYVLDMRHLIPA